MWLSGLIIGLQTKGSLVQFPCRAHAWIVGQVPSWGSSRGNHTLMFLSLFFSLPYLLSKHKLIRLKKKDRFLYCGTTKYSRFILYIAYPVLASIIFFKGNWILSWKHYIKNQNVNIRRARYHQGIITSRPSQLKKQIKTIF